VTVFWTAETSRTARIRSSDNKIGRGGSTFTCPPTNPVPPPQGTMPTFADAHLLTTSATCTVDAGRTKAAAFP